MLKADEGAAREAQPRPIILKGDDKAAHRRVMKNDVVCQHRNEHQVDILVAPKRRQRLSPLVGRNGGKRRSHTLCHLLLLFLSGFIVFNGHLCVNWLNNGRLVKRKNGDMPFERNMRNKKKEANALPPRPGQLWCISRYSVGVTPSASLNLRTKEAVSR